MLESIEVTKKYVGKIAVDGITMQLEPGHIYAMLGPNGSGKTTWMKMAAGLIKPTFGEIRYNGQPISIETRKEIAKSESVSVKGEFVTILEVEENKQTKEKIINQNEDEDKEIKEHDKKVIEEKEKDKDKEKEEIKTESNINQEQLTDANQSSINQSSIT